MGVWTLPPRLVLGEKDKDKYLDIGESDRMTSEIYKIIRVIHFIVATNSEARPIVNFYNLKKRKP